MTGPPRSKSRRERWRRSLPWLPTAAIVAAFALGWMGAGLWSSDFGTARVTLGEQFVGTVTLVSSDGSGVCLADDADGRQRCSSPFQLVGSPPLRVGEHIDVTVARVRVSRDLSVEVYIVTVPPPIDMASDGPTSAR